MSGVQHELRELTREEALRRLGSVELGRIAFTSKALPTVRPVNHLLDDGQIIIRARDGSSIITASSAERGVVVAYEADEFDTASRTGWSVVVTGRAWVVDDPQLAASYGETLVPWVAGRMSHVIRIAPEYVTGFELTG